MPSPPLNHRIRKFYDRSTHLWLEAWGEHMHHGYYGPDGKVKKDRRQAQVDLIKELLEWGQVRSANRILDAGCGVGGSARYLANRFDADVLGVTLSPVQVNISEQLTRNAGLEEKVKIQLRDMMSVGPTDGPFDLIWSAESAEHLADKTGLMENFFRLLEPGGRLLMATWCRRPIPPELSPREQGLLDKLSRYYQLPPMVSDLDLVQLAQQAGFRQVRVADRSDGVAPFWHEVVRSAFDFRQLALILQSGWSTIQGAWAIQYMIRGYREGLIRYTLLQAER